jgi:hypothetical protein
MSELLVCEQCGFETPSRKGMGGHRNRKDHQPGYVADVSRETSRDVPRETSEPAEEIEEVAPVPASDETAPRKPGLVERIRSRRGRGRDGGRTAPTTAERPPKRKRPAGRRVSLDADISDIWAFGGRRLESTPHYPTGRMLQYQAPAAGVIIDRAVAGTLPDRVLFQPLARNRDRYEDVGFLLAGPILTFSITTTMQRMQAAIDAGDKEEFDQLATKLQMQREMLTWLLSMLLPRLAAGAKIAADKKAKRDAVIADAFPDLAGEDPAETLADMLFVPPTFEEAQQNGRPDRTSTPSGAEGSVPFGV